MTSYKRRYTNVTVYVDDTSILAVTVGITVLQYRRQTTMSISSAQDINKINDTKEDYASTAVCIDCIYK